MTTGTKRSRALAVQSNRATPGVVSMHRHCVRFMQEGEDGRNASPEATSPETLASTRQRTGATR